MDDLRLVGNRHAGRILPAGPRSSPDLRALIRQNQVTSRRGLCAEKTPNDAAPPGAPPVRAIRPGRRTDGRRGRSGRPKRCVKCAVGLPQTCPKAHLTRSAAGWDLRDMSKYETSRRKRCAIVGALRLGHPPAWSRPRSRRLSADSTIVVSTARGRQPSSLRARSLWMIGRGRSSPGASCVGTRAASAGSPGDWPRPWNASSPRPPRRRLRGGRRP
jgi:hypothetical protein